MRNQRRRWPLLLIPVAVFGLTLSACGDDDDDTETGAGGTDTTTQQAAGDVSEYCDITFQLETVEEPDIDFESLSREQQMEEAKKFTREKFRPLAERLRPVVPAEVKSDVDVLFGALDSVEQTGDFRAFEQPQVEAASDRVHQYDLRSCGWARQDVVAVDYAFQGLTTAKAGPVSFEMRNTGKEMHELAVVKKKAGVTESYEQLIMLPEEEGRAKVDFIGGIEPTAPGETNYVVTDLEKGEYFIACFLPVGATPEAFAQAEETGRPPEGQPHALQGMRATLTVE